jgi:hypothetical protein
MFSSKEFGAGVLSIAIALTAIGSSTTPQADTPPAGTGGPSTQWRVERLVSSESGAAVKQDAFLQSVLAVLCASVEPDLRATALRDELRAAFGSADLSSADVRYYEVIDPITGDVVTVCIEDSLITVADPGSTNPVLVTRTSLADLR